MAGSPKFSKKTIEFLAAAGAETSPDWLKKHKREHEEYLIAPLSALAEYLADNLRTTKDARGYRFPLRGFGRLRRPKNKVGRGDPAYRNWVHLRAARPSKSLFDENPGLYFYLSHEEVFAGGGLYDASSRQIKQLRAWLAEDPKDLKALFASKAFKQVFPRGFEIEKSLKTFPRSYPQDHKRIAWLKLQAYFVTQKFNKKLLFSEGFKDLVLENWEQSLRLNSLLSDHFTIDDWQASRRSEAMDDESTAGTDLWDERL